MRYDTVVVGAGSTGAVVAARLAAADSARSVVLIEAGPDYPDLDSLPADLRGGTPAGTMLTVSSEHDWAFVGRATDSPPTMAVARGKVTGGSSAINGQIFLRGIPEDYDGWAEAGNEGWSFDALLPLFREVEDDRDFGDAGVHGAGGPIGVRRYSEDEFLPAQRAFYDAARATGYEDCPDHNLPSSTGVGPYPLNCPDGIRVSTAVGYLPAVRDLPNFTLLASTLVTRVLFDGKRAYGVEIDVDGRRSTIEANEIVLSAGAIGSPHLLLLSGVGPADHLRAVGLEVVHDLPGVGKHLQDHPTVYLMWKLAPNYVVPPGTPPVQMGLRYTASDSNARNDMWICPLAVRDVMMMVPGIHAPVAVGELRLVSCDPAQQPSLDYRYLEDEVDRRRLREGVRVCLELATRDAFADILGERLTPSDQDLVSDAQLDAWMRSVVTTSHHISGTCQMGPTSNPESVVDTDGRVHGLDGIRVVDASITPEIPRANTNATAIMIGEKVAAAMIREAGRSV